MTSPEVNVGSIIARVALDTSGLKKGEAEADASLKRTAAGMSQTAQSAEKVQKKVNDASTSIKRNTDVQVDAIRRTSQEQRRATRDAETRASRNGTARGAVAGVVAGQLISEGVRSLGGTNNQQLNAFGTVASAAAAGGAIGSIGGPEGAVIGGGIGGGIAAATRFNDLITTDAQRREDADREKMYAEIAEAQGLMNSRLEKAAQLTDNLGRAQLRMADATDKVNRLQKATTDPGAIAQKASLVAPLLGGIFDEHQRMTQGDAGKAVDKLVAANDRLQKAQDRVARLRAGGGGASRSSLLSAEASVESARAAAAKGGPGSALRLQAAEERLAELRRKGGTNTRGLAAAERDLETARRKADAAQAGATKAGLPAALDAKTLLSRLSVKESDTKALDRDTRTLVRKGLRAPVIEELLRTEKDAPGTIHKLASTLTRSQLMEFNTRSTLMQRAADDLIKAPLDRAYADARRDAERQATALATAQRTAYQKAFSTGQQSPNIPAPALLPGTTGDPLYTGMFTSGTTPRPQRPKGAPRGDKDYAPGSVTFTGPVTINDATPKGILAATGTRINALSRP